MNSTLRIVDSGGTHERPLFELLDSQGYCERMDVRLSRACVTNGAEAVERLLAGEAQAAIQIGFGPALSAIAKGAPLKVIAGANLLCVHAIYSRDPAIRALEDLAGRTLGVGRLGALTHQLATAALRKRRIDPATVEFVPIGSSATIFEAVLAGEVDAGFGEAEALGKQAEYGVHALEGGVLWKELPEFPNQASFATENALAENRDALVRALAAHAMLYRFVQSSSSAREYEQAWARALPGTPLDEAQAQWRFYQRYRPFAEDLGLPAAKVAWLQDLNIEMGLQAGRLPFGAIADMSLAHDALGLIDPKPSETSR